MKPLCEVVVKEVLPAVRTILIKDLLDSGLTQQDIAEKLNLSQPSISQHLRKIRGRNIGLLKKDKKIQKILGETAGRIKKEGESSLSFCTICREIRKRGIICKVHKKLLGINKCNVCLTTDVCGTGQ